MIKKKIQYRLSKVKDYISLKFSKVNLNLIIGAIGYVILMTFLVINGVKAYNRGMDNLKKFDEEQAATNVLIAQNEELKNLYRYYSSIDYKKIYARDNLNLGERGETLYVIEKDEELDVERKEPKIEPRIIDNLSLWRKLLFGI